MPAAKPHVKVACLACRSYKTRCDGHQPCVNCSTNHRECHYRPSRRGGARRGEQYQNAKRQRANVTNGLLSAHYTSPGTNGTFVDDLANLIYPFHSLQGGGGLVDADMVTGSLSPAASQSAVHQSAESFFIRSYRNEKDLVNAYYIFIHPYLPLLPPMTTTRFADNPHKTILTRLEPNRSSLPFWPTSPFTLALMALLVLVPLPEDADPMQEVQVELRKSYAHIYAKAALERIENFSSDGQPSSAAPISTPGMDEVPRSPIHPQLPCTLEPLLALLLLGVYEYCQNSNRRQMRSRIYNALILAMDLSLHEVGSASPESRDIQTRVWWITMFLVYQSAIFNHSSPIVLLNDSRISTPFPNIYGCQTLWPILMRAQEAMLKTGVIAKEMADGKVKGSLILLRQRVCELDCFILAIIADLDQPPDLQTGEGADAAAVLNQWLMARFLAHTARIKLHRFRAFGDNPVFLDKFCDLNSINSSLFSQMPLAASPGRVSEANSEFPFTEEESTRICLKAALVLSRTLRALPWPTPSYSDSPASMQPLLGIRNFGSSSLFSSNNRQYPRSLPYMACCGMQGCYVLMMLLRKIRTSLCSNNLSSCLYLLPHAEPGMERQDAERFIEELRHGVKSVCDFMLGNAVFGGVMDMAREVEAIYLAHFNE